MYQTQSPLDAHKDFVQELLASGKTYSDIIAALANHTGVKTSERSLRRALRRWGTTKPKFDRPGMRMDGDEMEITSRPSRGLTTPDELLQDRGLDPEDWEVKNLIASEWDAMTSDKATGDNRLVTMRQLKVTFVRKKPYEFIMPAVDGPSFRLERLHVKINRKAKLVVFVGCQQAPYQDPDLHDKFCQWLEYNRPDEGVLMGDTMDFPDISRHPGNPEWHVEAQDCINSAYLMLRDYVQASTSTEWAKLLGNHDERIRNRLINYMTGLYGIRPADIPGEDPFSQVWDVRHLLHLDSLGINLVEPDGKYTHATHTVTQSLAAIHGETSKKDAGASVLAELDEVRHSLVMAHTHRQGITHRTYHNDITGRVVTVAGMEVGTMAAIQGGLGYKKRPNWQNGFGTAIIWPDGDFKLELASYRDGKLTWRDQRF